MKQPDVVLIAGQAASKLLPRKKQKGEGKGLERALARGFLKV